MKVGVIGFGNIGGALACKLSAARYDVLVANSKGPEGDRLFADEIGAAAADTRGAVDSVDAVIISIPFPAVFETPEGSRRRRSEQRANHRHGQSLPRNARPADTGD